jgi:hypothetical protein
MLCRDEIADADFVSVELLYDSTTGHAYCFYLIMASILPDEDRAWVPVKLGGDIVTGGGQTPAQILPGDGSSCVLAFKNSYAPIFVKPCGVVSYFSLLPAMSGHTKNAMNQYCSFLEAHHSHDSFGVVSKGKVKQKYHRVRLDEVKLIHKNFIG